MKVKKGRDFSLIRRQMLWNRIIHEDDRKKARLVKEIHKESKITQEITLSMKGLKANEAAAIQLFKELDEFRRRKQTHQLILEKIEKSREHLNGLKGLYQTKAKKMSHLEELLQDSDDEDIQTKILRAPIIYVTD